jgi:crossover junction endodeoxyribonuclease RuvC
MQPSGGVIAIDPGFDRIGVSIMKQSAGGADLLFSECIVTSAKDTKAFRLQVIGSEIRRLIKKWKPKHLAIETLFFNQNITSAIGVAEARGVILYEASLAKLEIFEYAPQSVKAAVTGYGKADKLQVASMVKKLVKLEARGKKILDDEIDAIALGITHLATHRVI